MEKTTENYEQNEITEQGSQSTTASDGQTDYSEKSSKESSQSNEQAEVNDAEGEDKPDDIDRTAYDDEPSEDYTERIVAIDEQLDAIRAQEVEQMREHVFEIANVDDRYLKYITGTIPEEVQAELIELSDKFDGLKERIKYADPNAFNTRKVGQPMSDDERAKALGKRTFERVKSKIGKGIFGI